MVGSFLVGVNTAGDIQPVARSEAQQANLLVGLNPIAGDIDANGIIDVQDAISLLEIIQGYEAETDAALAADPNGDGLLTIDDALRILRATTLR